MIRYLLLSFALALTVLVLSCKGQQNKKFLAISPLPIYTELDSFVTSTNYLQQNKIDYFLVNTNISDTNKIMPEIDSFVARVYPKNYLKYDNYIIYFYRQSSEVNEKELARFNAKYKVFLDAKNDYLASYTFYDKRLVEREIGTGLKK